MHVVGQVGIEKADVHLIGQFKSGGVIGVNDSLP